MARSFNGTSDVITAGLATSATTNFSMAFWGYFNSTPSGSVCIFANGVGPAGGGGYAVVGDNTRTIYLNIAGITNVTGSTVPLNIWFHVAITRDTSTFTLYINGTSINTSSTAPNAPVTSTSMGAGTLSPFYYFPGVVMDCAIWNSVLNSTQVTALANGVRPGSLGASNLVGWWPLDGYASPETDLSVSGNNGTVTGTTRALGPPIVSRAMGS
jgi:hypothetical protein